MEDFVPAMTGVGFHVQCIAQQLLSLNYDVSIITTRQSHQRLREIWNGVSVFRVKTLKVMGYYQSIASAAKLKRLVQQIQPSIIHFHYLGFLLVRLRKIAKDLNIPSIYTYHMTVDHLAKNAMRPFKSMIGKKIVKYCNSTSRVIAVSKKLSTELQTELEVPVSSLPTQWCLSKPRPVHDFQSALRHSSSCSLGDSSKKKTWNSS
jgi:hypothetical protein